MTFLLSLPKLLPPYFKTHVSKAYAWRKKQLEALLLLLQENESAIIEALHKDLGKPMFEAASAEVVTVLTEVQYTLSNLHTWMQPIAVSSPSP